MNLFEAIKSRCRMDSPIISIEMYMYSMMQHVYEYDRPLKGSRVQYSQSRQHVTVSVEVQRDTVEGYHTVHSCLHFLHLLADTA